MAMLIGVMILNLVISFLNARNVGRIWAETKAVGGWIRLLAWCGAIQSAVGFTFVYAIVVSYRVFAGQHAGTAVEPHLSDDYRTGNRLGHHHHDSVVDKLRPGKIADESWCGRLEHVCAGVQHL